MTTTLDLDALLQVAKESAEQAYAPYSKYHVGSAVLTDKGVFSGFNIENASTPLGICAERAAMVNARIHGAMAIHAVAIWCRDASTGEDGVLNPETMPCGACRQWIAELAPDARIVTNGTGGRSFTIDELLPYGFRLPV